MVTRSNTRAQLDAIWEVLAMAREDCISEDENGPHDEQWQEVCDAMAWIAEDLDVDMSEEDGTDPSNEEWEEPDHPHPPRTLNGHTVVQAAPRKNMCGNDTYVVLIDRMSGSSPILHGYRWCVATWSPLSGDGWWWGKDAHDLCTALELFNERSA